MHRFLTLVLICFAATQAMAEVIISRVPDGGLQPQVAVDKAGTVHLLYFKGDPKAGDLFYTRKRASDAKFRPAFRVNTVGKAMAVGSIRGGHLAVGRNGRVHVTWMGAKPISVGKEEESPLYYTRLNREGSAFEPERNVITYAWGLDGGGSVAADEDGMVYVAWHANPPSNKEGEEGRAVFVARSTDEGASFGKESIASDKAYGSCACCGMRIIAASDGKVAITYRDADTKDIRSAVLLTSTDSGETFKRQSADAWEINTCPMSSFALNLGPNGLLVGWETGGEVRFGQFDHEGAFQFLNRANHGKGKHPVLAENAAGQRLLVWTEGTGWMKGGNLAWQLIGKAGQPLEDKGNIPGIPVWSFAACYSEPGGNFVILY